MVRQELTKDHTGRGPDPATAGLLGSAGCFSCPSPIVNPRPSKVLLQAQVRRLQGRTPEAKNIFFCGFLRWDWEAFPCVLGFPPNHTVIQTKSYPAFSVPGIRARNIFLHTWNLKSSEMTGSWISSLAGGGDSDRIFCSLKGGR